MSPNGAAAGSPCFFWAGEDQQVVCVLAQIARDPPHQQVKLFRGLTVGGLLPAENQRLQQDHISDQVLARFAEIFHKIVVVIHKQSPLHIADSDYTASGIECQSLKAIYFLNDSCKL